jgi:septum site-determining protein MinC
MALLRGTSQGLQITIAPGEFDASLQELSDALQAQPDFYRGSVAHLVFRSTAPSVEEFQQIRRMLSEAGITVEGMLGDESIERLTEESGLEYLGSAPPVNVEDLQRRRGTKLERQALSEGARSLTADFAGARSDFAAQRSTSALSFTQATTLYYRGTVRSGQVLRQLGNIVVVGDVNPGAELIASGDIVVFGTLRGQAHAGAQGDTTARVTAIELSPTQLRIATLIAAGEQTAPQAKSRARGEEARIEENRIVVVPIPGGVS